MVRSRSVAGRVPIVLAVVVAALAVSGITLHPWARAGASRPYVVATRLVKPRVLGVRPGVLPGRGGVKIVVTGSGFTKGTRVTVGGAAARVVAVRSDKRLVAVAPRGVGIEIVRAITPGGTSIATPASRVRFNTRVLVVGDSLGIDLGWGFTSTLDRRYDLTTMVDDAVGSTGLVRSDYYDWPTHLRADIAKVRPDVVVTLFGTNDQQAFTTKGGDVEPNSGPWNRLYSAKIREVASIVRAAGATLVWVGLPRMGPQSVLSVAYVRDVIKLDQTVVAHLPDAVFVPTWPLFTTSRGAYTPYVETSPHVWQLGHAEDGTHLTPAGAQVIDLTSVTALWESLTRH